MAHTPEEEVRQSFLSHWISNKGFPSGLISAEVALSSLSPVKMPNRRLDLVFFAHTPEGLMPLMLVECKSEKIDESARRQLVGYNQFVRAPYLCLASSKEIRYGAFIEEEGWVFSDIEPLLLQPLDK